MREDREPNAESSLATRRAALRLTAAMTAGLLAEKAISPDSAHAEGVSSVNGKTGAVELPGLTSEGDLPSTVVISSTDPLTISGTPTAGEVLTAMSGTAADWQQGGAPVFNVAAYASIQEAIEKAEEAGGGTVYVPVGTHEVSAAIKLGSNVSLVGVGMASIVKLKAGSKTSILETLHYGEKNATGFAIRNLVFDGNKTNCPEGKHGLLLEGANFVVENVTVRNAKGTGIYSENGVESESEETVSSDSMFINVRAHNNGETGIEAGGPIYSAFIKCLAWANGYAGIQVNAESIWVGCRAWGNDEFAFFLAGGQVMLVDCYAEEGNAAALAIKGSHSTWSGGEITNNEWAMGTSPLLRFTESPKGVQLVGVRFNRTTTVGEGPSIDLAEAGEALVITGTIQHEHANTAISGSWPENSTADLLIYGLTTTKSLQRFSGGWSAGTLGTHAIQKTGALTVGARAVREGVQLRGQIEAEKEITAASTIWTLPEGLRPSSALELPALLNTTMVVVKISTGGVVTCSAAMKAKEVLKLDGLTFDLA